MAFKKAQIKAVLLGLVILLISCVVILASVPPVSRDALTHHLAIPALYLKNGGIYQIPDAKFSYYPMNLDFLYLIPLYFGNDIIPKFIHFVFALLTAGLIFSYLRKRLDTANALLGVILFLSLPVIVKLSITVYVDLGLIFFSTAALLAFLKWVESNFALKPLLLAGLWCGLALGTKYNGLITLFLLTLFAVFVYGRSSPPIFSYQLKALAMGSVFFLVAVLIFSPWALRDYRWTGNPVYPLFSGWLHKGPAGTAAAKGREAEKLIPADSALKLDHPHKPWSHFKIRQVVFKESWWKTALIPVRIFFEGRDDDPRYFDGRLNPLLFFLPIVAMVFKKRYPGNIQTEIKILFFFAVLFILFAFIQRDMRIRYIGPAIPPLVILSILGLHALLAALADRLAGISKTIAEVSVVAVVLLLLSMNAVYILGQFRYVRPLDYLAGKLDRDAYIERYRPEYAALQYANRNTPTSATILGVFAGNRRYYSRREMLFDYTRWLLNPVLLEQSSGGVFKEIRQAGITHLLVRYDLFKKWTANNFTALQKKALNNFFADHTRLLFSKGGYGLFQIVARQG